MSNSNSYDQMVQRARHEVASGARWADVQAAWLACYSASPDRAEPLYEIAKHYRSLDENHLAFLFARRADELSLPVGVIDVDESIYAWRVADLLGICAWWIGEYEVGEKAVRKALAAQPGMPHLVKNLSFYTNRRGLPQAPQVESIHDWIARTFVGESKKTFLEIGAHCGQDTAILARVPGVVVHAFEPDPRNAVPPLPNVIVNKAAIGEKDGRSPFTLSAKSTVSGGEWTYSSSIRRPKKHLEVYPYVSFGETIEVSAVSLDSYCRDFDTIDFIWADVQGAEGDMIRGGLKTLARTRYLYTEFSNDELYEGQITLDEILKLLPEFRVLLQWPGDVLLVNEKLASASSSRSSVETKFYSQCGQDRHVYETYFKNKLGGVFVDVGAYDGVSLSNTKFFEDALGWTGLCIEPLPSEFEKLTKSRKAKAVRCAVSDYEGVGEFLDVDVAVDSKMLSGLVENYNTVHAARVASSRTAEHRITVPVRTLNSLLAEHGIVDVDYMSIDTEGSELKILQAFDFDRFHVKVFSVENPYDDGTIPSLMASKGYERTRVFQGYDDLYVHRDVLRERSAADRIAELRRLDPKCGRMPFRATPRRNERVLHVSLGVEPLCRAVASLVKDGGVYLRLDWLDFEFEERQEAIVDAARDLQPTLVFMQIQTADAIDLKTIAKLRKISKAPDLLVVAWCGDVGNGNGPFGEPGDAWAYDLAKECDLMLYSSMSQVHTHRAAGMHQAAYLQVGYNDQLYVDDGRDAPVSDVLFIGDTYDGRNFSISPGHEVQLRRDVVDAMRSAFGDGFRLFGRGWGRGVHYVDEIESARMYRRSRLALSVSLYNFLERYTSDRLLRALACGTPVLMKAFPDWRSFGLVHGENVLVWDTPEEAVAIAKEYLRPERSEELAIIGRRGALLARACHTWNVRMQEMAPLLAAVRGQTAASLEPTHGYLAYSSKLPKVTVFCAVWNKDPKRLDLLRGHMDNLKAQTQQVEVIYVFDGGDTPPTWLEGRIFTSPTDLTIYEAWDMALSKVRTPYAMNLNLDDRLAPDAVERLTAELETNDAALVGGDWRVCFDQEDTDATAPCYDARSLPRITSWPPPAGVLARLGSGTGELGSLGPATLWRSDLYLNFPTKFGDGSLIRTIADSVWWRTLDKAGYKLVRLAMIIGNYHSHPSEQAEFRGSCADEERRLLRFGVA